MTQSTVPVERPKVLLLSARADFACDYVVSELRQCGVSYLRINSEDLGGMEVGLSPSPPRLRVRTSDTEWLVEPDEVSGILFRRPVYFRETGAGGSGAELLARSQWGVFIRSLMVFDNVRWVNHPARVYFAEHKAVQLRVASEVGFRIPETTISNSPLFLPPRTPRLAIKGLDAILYSDGDQEFFGYTQLVDREELTPKKLSALPTVVQAAVTPKIDLRVTVVGNDMWCAEIRGISGPIPGDWRERKDAVSYRARLVGEELRRRILSLMERLGLVYGAIDLAERDGEIFFLEINPTGEWAWLEKLLGFPVSRALARLLDGGQP